jgi:ribosomal protein S18 acetylase RimI-like enzyme
MINYTIKLMTPDHYDEVLQLWKSNDGIGLSDSDSKENITKFLEKNEGLSFVTLTNNKVIGAVLGGHDGRRGYMYHLAVDPGNRYNGIGKSLVNACIKRFKEIGIVKSHIIVLKDNEKGIEFWEKMRFDLRHDIMIMSLNIK